PLVRRNLAQSNMLTDRSMTLPVQAHQLVFEAELFPPALALHQLLAFVQRLLEHGLIKLPRPMLIGVGQGGPLGRHRLPLATGQAAANLAPRMRPSQLAK